MTPDFSLDKDSFAISNYNQARPFSSFLPGIAGPFGKPMWVFYTNRGQCISSFGVWNKNSAMLEFYPANKAYQNTPLLGFRTFLKIRSGSHTTFYEPFQGTDSKKIRQTLKIRAHDIELTEKHLELGLEITAAFFNPANEDLPLLVRDIRFHNCTRQRMRLEVLDGLPQIVSYGLGEWSLKEMSRTMEAFVEVLHVSDHLPFYKLKVEPSDKPEVQWIQGGFFSFTQHKGQAQKMIVDPESIFGTDTSFQHPQAFLAQKKFTVRIQRLDTLTPSAFSHTLVTLGPGQEEGLQSFYGQADAWAPAMSFQKRMAQTPKWVAEKRRESAQVIREVSQTLSLHTGVDRLDAYAQQCYLDNTLRGGQPLVVSGESGEQVFHYYSRKHGDMERDYNFFELSPTYFSQGNGNFRDVNQNRRSEALLYVGLKAANVETFFNLIQLDGFNPLVIQYERFYVEKELLGDVTGLVEKSLQDDLAKAAASPFKPGDLFELLRRVYEPDQAMPIFLEILSKAKKIQEAAHGEGYWIDHWTYNLDLLENFLAVYPDQARSLFVERRDFTYYDNAHVVQPRFKKYRRRPDGHIRQLQAVVSDPEKHHLIHQRILDPHKVRTRHGTGPIYQTSLLVKVFGLLAVKAASLDPMGVGLEMEADKPGWCDALNGLPALLGSSVNESLELQRWVRFLNEWLPALLSPGETHKVPQEVAEFVKAVGEALALSRPDDFFKTWDTLATLKETFRERTRLGVSGEEMTITREELATFLASVDRALETGVQKAFLPNGLCATYFTHEAVRYELLPTTAPSDPKSEVIQHVRVLQFKQQPLNFFLEGPVHALRVIRSLAQAKKLYQAVKASELYDRKLKMFKLNVPLTKESYEIGRNKIFTPGWLENESIFLHMAYKFLLETLRCGLVEEFFEDFKNGLIAFQDPKVYGRSILENSSFLASSSFPDARVHGAGFVARLTGATAEWISMVLYMGLGRQPFQWRDNELRFEPQPTLAGWLFQLKAVGDFWKDTFGFKLFGKTWIVYHNPSRRDTFGKRPLRPVRYHLFYANGESNVHEGTFLPHAPACDLRDGKLTRLIIQLA